MNGQAGKNGRQAEGLWRRLTTAVVEGDRAARRYWRGGTLVVGTLTIVLVARNLARALVRREDRRNAAHPARGIDMRASGSGC